MICFLLQQKKRLRQQRPEDPHDFIFFRRLRQQWPEDPHDLFYFVLPPKKGACGSKGQKTHMILLFLQKKAPAA